MMNKPAVSILMLALLCISSAALAGPMQAGLWEVSMKSDAMKKMPQMSAQQIAQMKKMGMNVPEMRDGGMVNNICVTKEMAEREQPPHMERDHKNCQTKNVHASGNTYTADIVCNGPELKGSGTNFDSTYNFKGMAHGHPINSLHETSGQWLGADCGKVKPIAARK